MQTLFSGMNFYFFFFLNVDYCSTVMIANSLPGAVQNIPLDISELVSLID